MREARKELAEAARPEMEALKDAAETEEAKRKAEWDALYQLLPETLRQRADDGFAGGAEVLEAMRSILRSDAGYGPCETWSDRTGLSVLTDAEFARLVEVRDAAPEGATCRPIEVWDVEEHESHDEYFDDEGEEHVNVRRVILITWTDASGIEVTATEPLT